MVPDVFATTRLSQMISIINLICYAEELPDSSMCSFAYYNLSLSLSLSRSKDHLQRELHQLYQIAIGNSGSDPSTIARTLNRRG